jgi:uncharacterized membrane protein
MAGLPATESDSLGARLWLLTRRAPGLVAMLLMAVAGLGVSIYLTTVHYQGVAPVCNTTGLIDCARVTSSSYSVLPGPGKIPITIPGMIWFVVSGGLALVALVAIWRNQLEPSRLRLAHLLWGVVGMVFVLYLVYAEIVALHRLCEWCTVVHLLTFATFLLALNRWMQRDLPAPTLYAAVVRRAANGSPSAQVSASGGKRRIANQTTTTTATRQQVSANGARRPAGSGGSGGKSGRRPRR